MSGERSTLREANSPKSMLAAVPHGTGRAGRADSLVLDHGAGAKARLPALADRRAVDDAAHRLGRLVAPRVGVGVGVVAGFVGLAAEPPHELLHDVLARGIVRDQQRAGDAAAFGERRVLLLS